MLPTTEKTPDNDRAACESPPFLAALYWHSCIALKLRGEPTSRGCFSPLPIKTSLLVPISFFAFCAFV